MHGDDHIRHHFIRRPLRFLGRQRSTRSGADHHDVSAKEFADLASGQLRPKISHMDNLHTVRLQDVDQAEASPVSHLEVMRNPDCFDLEGTFILRFSGEDHTLPIVVSEMLMTDQNPVCLDPQFWIAVDIIAVIGINDDAVALMRNAEARMSQPLYGHWQLL